MAINEGCRMDGQFMVISLCPDVCKSPLVPVPYPIVGYLDKSIFISPNVRARGTPVFHMGSRVATVVGDEGGAGGGVMSQVFKGMCRPITPVPNVRVNGNLATHHQNTLMFMNCAGPEGPFNTIGVVKFVGLMVCADVGPAGTIPADSNPPVSAEGFAEGGCLPKLQSLSPAAGGGLGDIVGLAQQAYALATTDWSNPASVLGAMGGVAGMAGMGSLASAAGIASGVAAVAGGDWANAGSAMGAAMNMAGTLMGGGPSSSSPPTSLPSMGGQLPPDVICRPCF